MKTSKKVIILAGLMVLALIAAFSATSNAKADNDDEDNGLHLGQLKHQLMMSGEMSNLSEGFDMKIDNTQESVVIQPNGNFRVTGAVLNSVSTSTNTINASIFNFSRDVSVASATIFGAGKQIVLTDLQAGDKLVVTGNFNRTNHVITISDINDVTYVNRNNLNIQNQIQALMQQVQLLQQQLQALLQGVGH